MAEQSQTRTVFKTCPLCEATCGLAITLQGDQVTHVTGDKLDVFSKGYLCPKGASIAQLHNDPDRLRRPLMRIDGQLREVSWPEAFQAVEQGLGRVIAEHGRDAVAVYLGNPNSHTMAGNLFMRPMLKALASKNIFSASSVDQLPKHVSCGLMFGSPATIPVPDIERTDYLLMLGANPLESNGSLCTAPDFPGRLRALRQRGAKLVVIDPRRTRTAELADEHFFIRPGTDALLLMAMVNSLFAQNLADPGPMAQHVNGLDDLRELSRPFTPQAVAGPCGLAAADIQRLARELAQAPSAVVYGRMGASTQEFGALANWLIDAINVLIGSFDRPGGAMFPTPAHLPPRFKAGGKGWSMGRWTSPATGAPEVIGEFPVATLAQTIEAQGAGAARALITIAGNPALTCPNSQRLDKALASLDFLVCVDFYLNETARHADVILPPCGPLSTAQYDIVFYGFAVHNVANFSPPVIAPGPDELDKWQIMLKLALILAGQGAAADPLTLEQMIIEGALNQAIQAKGSPLAGRQPAELLAQLHGGPGPGRLLDLMLRTGAYGDWFGLNPQGLSLDVLLANPHGVDLGPLKPGVPNVLRTPSAKIELAPSPLAADVDRLAQAMERPPAGTLLVGRRNLRSNNSWMHNIPPLVAGKGRCTLLVHPQDAAALGLEDGKTAVIASRVGSLQMTVELSEALMPGVVCAPHGWGHHAAGSRLSVAAANPGVNSNVLTDDQLLDKLSGNCVLNGIPVTIQPAA